MSLKIGYNGIVSVNGRSHGLTASEYVRLLRVRRGQVGRRYGEKLDGLGQLSSRSTEVLAVTERLGRLTTAINISIVRFGGGA